MPVPSLDPATRKQIAALLVALKFWWNAPAGSPAETAALDDLLDRAFERDDKK